MLYNIPLRLNTHERGTVQYASQELITHPMDVIVRNAFIEDVAVRRSRILDILADNSRLINFVTIEDKKPVNAITLTNIFDEDEDNPYEELNKPYHTSVHLGEMKVYRNQDKFHHCYTDETPYVAYTNVHLLVGNETHPDQVENVTFATLVLTDELGADRIVGYHHIPLVVIYGDDVIPQNKYILHLGDMQLEYNRVSDDELYDVPDIQVAEISRTPENVFIISVRYDGEKFWFASHFKPVSHTVRTTGSMNLTTRTSDYDTNYKLYRLFFGDEGIVQIIRKYMDTRANGTYTPAIFEIKNHVHLSEDENEKPISKYYMVDQRIGKQGELHELQIDDSDTIKQDDQNSYIEAADHIAFVLSRYNRSCNSPTEDEGIYLKHPRDEFGEEILALLRKNNDDGQPRFRNTTGGAIHSTIIVSNTKLRPIMNHSYRYWW